MKKNIRTIAAAGMTVLTMAIGATSAFAAGVSDVSKDSSSLSMLGGTAEIVSQKKAEFENEHSNGTLTSKQVTVNTQKISAEDGTVKIKNSKETSYKNSSSRAIVDIKVGINAPIIEGDADVEIENENTTTLDGVKADYVKTYEFDYNHPFYVKK